MRKRARIESIEGEGFLAELKRQRWDDHRLYHHSRVNQSLHFVSALSFLSAYVLLSIQATIAPLVGWLLAMWSRQVGHFFFEPKGFDEVNKLSHKEKEDIKVGYNLRRKVILLTLWAISPAILHIDPSFFGLLEPHRTSWGFVESLSVIWLALGVGALLGRTIQLFFIGSVQTGLVWCTKILTDPFHDLVLYWRAPLRLMRGEMIDPMFHVNVAALHDDADEPERSEARA
jgi:hypothetical protein